MLAGEAAQPIEIIDDCYRIRTVLEYINISSRNLLMLGSLVVGGNRCEPKHRR
jgi:hypothetical protein